MVMPRKSIENLKVSGTYKESRHGGRNPPKPELSDDLKPPAWLNRKAKRLYRKLAGELIKAGLLTTLDSEFLAIYCALYVKIADSLESGQDVGPSLMAQLRGMANDLGMSPSGRERLTVTPPKKKGPSKWGVHPSR